MKYMNFPEFSTDRLKLSRLTSDDVEDIFKLFSNEKVIEHYDLGALTQPSQALSLINFFDTRYVIWLGEKHPKVIFYNV